MFHASTFPRLGDVRSPHVRRALGMVRGLDARSTFDERWDPRPFEGAPIVCDVGEESDETGIALWRHPEALVRDDPIVRRIVSAWRMTDDLALPIDAYDKIAAIAVHGWRVLTAAAARGRRAQ